MSKKSIFRLSCDNDKDRKALLDENVTKAW